MEKYVLIQLQFALLLIAIVFSMSESSILTEEQGTIRFVSNLTNNEPLYIQVKYSNQIYHTALMKFRESEDLQTVPIVYTCDLWYPKSLQHHVNFKAFEPKEAFFSKCGGSLCIWTATYEGIYLTNIVTNKNVLMYKWES
ncbi:hypothetical protein ACFE04_002624 [Oxalis oulophora]